MFEKVFNQFYNSINFYLLERKINENILSTGSLADLNNIDKFKNKIFVSCYAVVKENSIGDDYSYEQSGNIFLENKSPLFFDMHLLACSTFQEKQFLEGLKYFSEFVGFLQVTKKINIDNNDSLKSANLRIIDKTESESLEIWQQFNITPKPAVFFKISTIPILGEAKKVEAQRISKVDLDLDSMF